MLSVKINYSFLTSQNRRHTVIFFIWIARYPLVVIGYGYTGMMTLF